MAYDKFTVLKSTAVPMPIENVDTDQIIPARFLKATERKEDYSAPEAKVWAGAKETYTLKDRNGKTELLIHTDSAEEYMDMFNTAWPKALDAVKQLSEN